MANIKYADPTYTLITPTDDDQVMFRTGAGGDGRAPLVQPKGYIDGLKLEWVSGTQVRVTTGAAYVPGPKRIAELTTAVTLTPSLSASTWYYVYLLVASGVVSAEAVTTVPAAPYAGTARAKTGDTSRRYLGAFKTDASGSIIGFDTLPGGLLLYRIQSASFGNFQILNGGASTTPVDLDCSGYVPITSPMGYFQLQINAGTLTNLMPSGITASPIADLVVAKGSGIGLYVGACRIGNAQKVAYQANDASSLTYIWIKGYYEVR